MRRQVISNWWHPHFVFVSPTETDFFVKYRPEYKLERAVQVSAKKKTPRNFAQQWAYLQCSILLVDFSVSHFQIWGCWRLTSAREARNTGIGKHRVRKFLLYAWMISEDVCSESNDSWSSRLLMDFLILTMQKGHGCGVIKHFIYHSQRRF